ncbi:DUF4189 domain-containing protein [Stenotrophomonas thermophila]
MSTGKRSKSEAEAEAVMQCRHSGGRACRTSFSYENQCIAAVAAPVLLASARALSA